MQKDKTPPPLTMENGCKEIKIGDERLDITCVTLAGLLLAFLISLLFII